MEKLKQNTKQTEEEKRDAGSDSDSASVVVRDGSAKGSSRGTAGAENFSKFFRKRPRPEDDILSSSDGELVSARKIPTNRRGKGREGAKGRGLTSRAACQRAVGLAEEGRHSGSPSPGASRAGSSGGEPDAVGGPEQGQKAEFALTVEAAVRDVALKRTQASKNRAISVAAATILAAAEASYRGPPPDATSKLRAEVARLAASMERLQQENAKLRADLAALQGGGPRKAPQAGRKDKPDQGQSAPVEHQVLDLVRQEMAAFRERFSVLEGIVLRPPLAANQRASGQGGKAASYATVAAKAGKSGQANPGAGPAATAAPAKPAPGKPVAAKQKKGGAAAQAAKAPAQVAKAPTQAVQQPPPSNPPSNSSAADAGWHVVGEKKKAAKAARSAKRRERKRRQKERRVANMLRAPKSAAVVLTLQPEAVKRGVSYGDVLAKAKETVNLTELGIVGGLRLRVTMTGARMLEIPGASSGPTADALAERLRASLDAEDARVTRPTKCIDMRILGLDDSVTKEEIVAAVVRTGGCSAEQVKAGTIRPDFTGMRTVVVSCPVTAAKIISEGRRLLVGWVSAQVKLLEPRPLRCFRCRVGNHTGALCTSEVDRSDLCFRCGQPGHFAGSCNATPHCVACAAAGKPAEHWAGGKTCAPPTKAGGKKKPSTAVSTVATSTAAASANAVAAAAAATAAPAPSQGPGEEAVMECQ